MKCLKIALLLLSFTPGLSIAAQTIYSEKYGSCWKTAEAAKKYPKKPSSKVIKKHLGCKKYKVVSSGADTCEPCKWVNSYTKKREHKCKGYVVAVCK